MSAVTGISWCDSTFNPWIGCTKVSPACDHCYAARQDEFRKWTPEGWGGPRRRTSAALWKLPAKWNAKRFMQCEDCGWRGEAAAPVIGCGACGSIELSDTRRRVFCASLADVFDNQAASEWRGDLFELIRVTPHLDWLLLTKRPQNIVRMVREQGAVAGNGTRYLPDNVRLGTTAEDQTRANINLPALLRTRKELGARSLFVSVEPMLGPMDLQPPCTAACPNGGNCEYDTYHKRRLIRDSSEGGTWIECACSRLGGLDWVICGGESGPQARPMHPDWVRSLRDQCAAAEVPFHFKQWGEWRPYDYLDTGTRDRTQDKPWQRANGSDFERGLVRVGTNAAGRLLDGVEHNGVPA